MSHIVRNIHIPNNISGRYPHNRGFGIEEYVDIFRNINTEFNDESKLVSYFWYLIFVEAFYNISSLTIKKCTNTLLEKYLYCKAKIF